MPLVAMLCLELLGKLKHYPHPLAMRWAAEWPNGEGRQKPLRS